MILEVLDLVKEVDVQDGMSCRFVFGSNLSIRSQRMRLKTSTGWRRRKECGLRISWVSAG